MKIFKFHLCLTWWKHVKTTRFTVPGLERKLPSFLVSKNAHLKQIHQKACWPIGFPGISLCVATVRSLHGWTIITVCCIIKQEKIEIGPSQRKLLPRGCLNITKKNHLWIGVHKPFMDNRAFLICGGKKLFLNRQTTVTLEWMAAL